MTDNTENSAFPNTRLNRSASFPIMENFGGLSKREYFIAKAMNGLCANPNFNDSSETYIASRAITIANRTLLCMGDE